MKTIYTSQQITAGKAQETSELSLARLRFLITRQVGLRANKTFYAKTQAYVKQLVAKTRDQESDQGLGGTKHHLKLSKIPDVTYYRDILRVIFTDISHKNFVMINLALSRDKQRILAYYVSLCSLVKSLRIVEQTKFTIKHKEACWRRLIALRLIIRNIVVN